MINELKVGDYIEKSELDTEQKYNNVVEVFKQWGFEWGDGACGIFSNIKQEKPIRHLVNCDDGLHQVCNTAMHRYAKRKLTYSQVMSIKKTDIDNSNEPKKDGNKYHREIIGFCGTKVEVDIYRVLDAYKTGSASLDHAAKKVLCAGVRGHKNFITDIDNAIESLQEAKALHLQKMEIDNQ